MLNIEVKTMTQLDYRLRADRTLSHSPLWYVP